MSCLSVYRHCVACVLVNSWNVTTGLSQHSRMYRCAGHTACGLRSVGARQEHLWPLVEVVRSASRSDGPVPYRLSATTLFLQDVIHPHKGLLLSHVSCTHGRIRIDIYKSNWEFIAKHPALSTTIPVPRESALAPYTMTTRYVVTEDSVAPCICNFLNKDSFPRKVFKVFDQPLKGKGGILNGAHAFCTATLKSHPASACGFLMMIQGLIVIDAVAAFNYRLHRLCHTTGSIHDRGTQHRYTPYTQYAQYMYMCQHSVCKSRLRTKLVRSWWCYIMTGPAMTHHLYYYFSVVDLIARDTF